MPSANFTAQNFTLEQATTMAFMYFRLEITHTANCFQLSEISISGTAVDADCCTHPNPLIHHERNEATCLPGNIEYWSCPVCNQYFCSSTASEENKISADDIVISPTVSHSYHEVTHKCSNCGTFDATVVASGKAGNCEWSLTNEGALAIFPTSGTSATLSYSQYPGWNAFRTNVKSVKIVGEVIPSLTRNMFYECSNLASADLTGLNTANVTDMYAMFYNCKNLTKLDLSNFNTANVKSMYYMFFQCTELQSVTFGSNFTTANVTNMHGVFYHCDKLASVDLSNFNTEKVTDMSRMFYSCKALTSLDLSKFNTANVEQMYYMFLNCEKLKSLDISNFTTEKMKKVSELFRGCSQLETLTIGNFDELNFAESGGMFLSCTNLKTLTIKAVPYLNNLSFCNVSWTNVNYELDDNSMVYTGTMINYLPKATTAPTYTRSIAATSNWGTVVLPFEAKSDAQVQLYELTAVANGAMTFSPVATVAANTPCVFKKKVANATSVVFTANSAAISPASPSEPAAVDGLAIRGTYKIKKNQTGMYFIAQDKFWYAESPITINPFRAWFEGTLPSQASLRIEEADNAEDLQLIEREDGTLHMVNGKCHDLMGRQISGQKGLQIRDGKVIMVK